MKTEIKHPQPFITREEFVKTLSQVEQRIAVLCDLPKKDIPTSFREILDAKMNTKIGGTKHV